MGDAERTIFLTNGTRFLGPYQVGDLAIARGTADLRSDDTRADVYRVEAATLDEARRKWARKG